MSHTHQNPTPPGAHHGHRDQRHGDDGHRPDGDGQAEILDLDAKVLAGYNDTITAWLPLRDTPREVVDLGCGTGAGVFALLERFPLARVTAVDSSPEHLERVEQKARAAGVADRVRTVRVDLDQTDWPDLGTPDLVWSSAAMHHMAEPDRVLRGVRDLLAPGGLFALVELAGFPRFLPENAPEERPGLEERCHEASDRRHAEHMPDRGADWGPRLTTAGFTLEGERSITMEVSGADDAAVGAYALGGLRRIRHAVADTLSPEDLAALDRLLDTEGAHSLLNRDDLAVRTERTVWAARRAD